ncbi:MAG: BRCT domain-containing protein [Nitrospirota bacterium]|nr:BRCT domain-containing protein [Nitrospirota bacterium]
MDRERLKQILSQVKKTDGTDDHGQPINKAFNASRLARRAIDEIIGIGKGIVADGIVTQEEAEFLIQWIIANEHVASVWPVNILYNRLNDFLSDNILDENEKRELLKMLHDFTGGGAMEKYDNASTALPLCNPAPQIKFEGHEFCFTGKFVFGTRNNCIKEVKLREGFFNPEPRENTDYLIIGLIGSSDWIHTTHGRKIEQAVQMKNKGHRISIVSEKHWVNSL